MRQSYFDQAAGLSMFRLGSVLRAAAILSCLSATVSAQTAPAPPQAKPTAPAGQAPAAPASPAAQAPPSAALPSARSIIDRYVEAIGGRKAVLAHSSTHASGTMSMPSSGVSGSVEVYAARPNKSFIKLTLGGIGE